MRIEVRYIAGPEEFWVESLFLAFYKGQVVSYCALRVRTKGKKIKRKIGYTDIFVVKRYRKRGIGIMMKTCALAWAFTREHADRMETTVERANVASINSCLTQGYDIIKSRSTKKHALLILRRGTWALGELRKEFNYPCVVETKRRK